MNKPRIRKYGESAILMEWEAIISPVVNDEVVATANYVRENHAEFILEVVPSYQSLTVFLKDGVDVDHFFELLLKSEMATYHSRVTKKVWQIPVCYDLEFGLDLQSLIDVKNLKHEDIVALHTEPKYRIYGIGFLPGFLYLGGLNEQLFSPRRGVVKRFAPKGSVAIGGEQTGVYPQESPGGWNIIGRTPVGLFDSSMNPPMPFSIGDSIRFYSINKSEFNQLEKEVSAGNYSLKPSTDD